jgi:hypothetical protein
VDSKKAFSVARAMTRIPSRSIVPYWDYTLQALKLDGDSRLPLGLGEIAPHVMAEIAFDFERPSHLPQMGLVDLPQVKSAL